MIRGISFAMLILGTAWLLGGAAGLAGVGQTGAMHEAMAAAAVERESAAADERIAAAIAEKETAVERADRAIGDAKERVTSRAEQLAETTATLDEKIATRETERDTAEDEKVAKRADAAIAFLTKLRDEKQKKPQAALDDAQERVRELEAKKTSSIAAADARIEAAQRGKTDGIAALAAASAKSAPQASYAKPAVATGLGAVLTLIGGAMGLAGLSRPRRVRPTFASSPSSSSSSSRVSPSSGVRTGSALRDGVDVEGRPGFGAAPNEDDAVEAAGAPDPMAFDDDPATDPGSDRLSS